MSTITSAVRSSAAKDSRKRAARVQTATRRAPSAYYWMVWPAVSTPPPMRR